MVDIQALRKNNIVKDKKTGQLLKVKNLTEKIECASLEGDKHTIYTENELEYVLLTLEMLGKLGFIVNRERKTRIFHFAEYTFGAGNTGHIYHDMYDLVNKTKFNFVIFHTIVLRDLKYVHKLQNIFYDINEVMPTLTEKQC